MQFLFWHGGERGGDISDRPPSGTCKRSSTSCRKRYTLSCRHSQISWLGLARSTTPFGSKRYYAGACQPASAHNSPLTAEFASMKQIASAISSGRISLPSCVNGKIFLPM